MKRKDGFVSRQVGGKVVAVPVGERTEHFSGMITLNGTAALLWDELAEERTETELVEALTAAYDVTPEAALADVRAFVKKLADAHLLEP
ncbi:MAG: PqqD family protein [Clostridia bacterium]|nr:PqqD family protein [Clostridia bacterium]